MTEEKHTHLVGNIQVLGETRDARQEIAKALDDAKFTTLLSLDDEKLNHIMDKLDAWARSVDRYEFGLPYGTNRELGLRILKEAILS